MNDRSKWIWKEGYDGPDTYCDFYDEFEYSEGKATIRISADSNYELYINGVFVESGQYADYPHYKIYDEFELTKYCKKGLNRVAITVWYHGEPSFTYYPGSAALRYEIATEKSMLCFSNEDTLCRESREFENHRCKKITGQIGYGFHYDITGYDGWRDGNLVGFEHAKTVEQELPLFPRPVKKLEIKDVAPSTTIKAENGTHFLIDLEREEVGYLTFKLRSDKRQKILFAYGEHIMDGGVRRTMGNRDFSVEVTVGEGINCYTNHFRRLGLRYLEVFAEYPIEPEYISVKPVCYPLKKVGILPKDELDRRIYEVCVRTLELCMHEHYEDCPWREQALYCLDSRNQMLCGYYCFEEYDFARASLKLMSMDRRYDGLLSICFPSGRSSEYSNGLAIPSFSLHYFTQVWEYIKYSRDVSLAKEIYPKLKSVMSAFTSRIEDGCVKSFSGVDRWNFYEWRKGLEGHLSSDDPETYEAALNCFLVIALENMKKIADSIGIEENVNSLVRKLRAGIRERFFDKESGLFYNLENKERLSVLVNSLAILAGACSEEEAVKIAEIIVAKDSPLVPVTLSMLCFKYDALLKVSKEKYKEYVLDEIREKYKRMLDDGATSFWEVETAKTTPAGSLCHGWSALPIYYYEILK